MSSNTEVGNGTGGKGTAPTPTPPQVDMAGMAVEMQSMLPEAHLLPLFYLNLKLEHELLANEFAKLCSYLKSKGLDYE